jgi:tetratricopeptide repeat protein 21B
LRSLCQVLYALKDYDEAKEAAQRCLSINPNCVQALSLDITHTLARVGNYQEVCMPASKLDHLISVLDKVEPCNHHLYARFAIVPARLAGRNVLVLQQTATLVQRAIGLSPNNPQTTLSSTDERSVVC